jgi:hypothetical protein
VRTAFEQLLYYYEKISLHPCRRRTSCGLRAENRNRSSRRIACHQSGNRNGGNCNSSNDTLNNCQPTTSNTYMNKYICLLMGAALLAACEQKETTVTNPPGGEKKESSTTIVNPSPATSTKTESKTDINVNTSPSP